MTTREAAAAIGVHRQHVICLCNHGLLKATKDSRGYFVIDADSVNRYMEEQRQTDNTPRGNVMWLDGSIRRPWYKPWEHRGKIA